MKAILRVSKIKGAGSARGKSEHNYRQKEVLNADKERSHLNAEYVANSTDIWEQCNTRIEEAGVKRKVKDDAVRGMEFILTASPEFFSKDEKGNCQDVRKSSWLKANYDFMQQTYGKNVVAFTLHQDEKTPHIHAIVVPITEDNCLSAKKLFNPKTLRTLQTDYAQAMKGFGLERGVEGSTSVHQTMKKIYGSEKQLIKEFEAVKIDKPTLLDFFQLEEWKKQQERQVNQALFKAQSFVLSHENLKRDNEALKKRLNTSEGLKQGNFKKLQDKTQELTNTYLLVATGNTEKVKEKGIELQNQLLQTFKKDFDECAKGRIGVFSLGTVIEKMADTDKYHLAKNQSGEVTGLGIKGTSFYFGMDKLENFHKEVQKSYQTEEKQQEKGKNLGLGF